MKRFIRSSSRTKADPAYYRRKWERLSSQIHSLLVECERIDPSGCAPMTAEEAVIRRRITALEGRQQWAATQLVVACRMVAEKKVA